MLRYMFLLASSSIALLIGPNVCGGETGHGHCRTTCPNCHACCTLKVESGKEEKSCWEIECEEICIPCVVFPWQKWKADRNGGHASGCPAGCDGGHGTCACGSCAKGKCSCVNNGARVKVVKKLKKKTYECPKCKYEWSPSCCCNGNGCTDPGCCGVAGCCDSAGCDDSAPAQPAAPAPTAADAGSLPVPDFEFAVSPASRTTAIPLRPSPTKRRSLSDR